MPRSPLLEIYNNNSLYRKGSMHCMSTAAVLLNSAKILSVFQMRIGKRFYSMYSQCKPLEFWIKSTGRHPQTAIMVYQGPEWPSCFQQRENQTKSRQHFQTLDNRQCRTVIPDRRETNEVSPVISHLLSRAVRTGCKRRELRAQQSLWVMEIETTVQQSQGGPKLQGRAPECTAAQKNSWDLQKFGLRTDLSMCHRRYSRARREPLESRKQEAPKWPELLQDWK